MNQKYHPESYWSNVAERIGMRDTHNLIAGDDEPYYRYKKKKFLNLLKSLNFNNKNVMELGSGPGGNLAFVLDNFKPKTLTGVDISTQMLELAKSHLSQFEISLIKINGTYLPFEDKKFDLTFTATVLQHNTDENMLKSIVSELCRVTNDSVVIFEKIEPVVSGDELCMGRPVAYYSALFQNLGFKIVGEEFINIKISYYVCGAIRKLFNASSRLEGEPLSKISIILENIFLPITKVLDRIFVSKRNIGKLTFKRIM